MSHKIISVMDSETARCSCRYLGLVGIYDVLLVVTTGVERLGYYAYYIYLPRKCAYMYVNPWLPGMSVVCNYLLCNYVLYIHPAK